MIRRILGVLRSWKRARRHERPLIKVFVRASALTTNLSAIGTLAPQWAVIPVLKSNAYGHGLALVAHILEAQASAPYFALDSYFEARALRDAGITTTLLILGHTPTETIAKNQLADVVFAVASLEQLRALFEKGTRARIHIKFDTGMHRQGIMLEKLDEVVALVHAGGGPDIEGIFSHLADAESPGSALTDAQIGHWNALVRRFREEFPRTEWFHLANSAGFAHADRIDANAGRTGIALYGINPGNLSVPLAPALSVQSVITEVRNIAVGEHVGYNGTFVADRATRVATIPVGYFEGVDRRLSNKGMYLIGGKSARILGRVSMNISSCDITDLPLSAIGDAVVVISGKTDDPNSAESIARVTGTIPYEVLVRIPAHLQRLVEP